MAFMNDIWHIDMVFVAHFNPDRHLKLTTDGRHRILIFFFVARAPFEPIELEMNKKEKEIRHSSKCDLRFTKKFAATQAHCTRHRKEK